MEQENGMLWMSKINDHGEGEGHNYGERNENGATIKFETQVIKSNLCDYSDAYTIVREDNSCG